MIVGSSPLEAAQRLFSAIEAGDTAAITELYDPDVRIWHNYDGIEQTREENLRILGWMAKNVGDLRYEEIRRDEIPGGFVQRHVLRGIGPSGQAFAMPACLFGFVRDGRIVRIEEYLDSAQTAALR